MDHLGQTLIAALRGLLLMMTTLIVLFLILIASVGLAGDLVGLLLHLLSLRSQTVVAGHSSVHRLLRYAELLACLRRHGFDRRRLSKLLLRLRWRELDVDLADQSHVAVASVALEIAIRGGCSHRDGRDRERLRRRERLSHLL